jgi:deazaflavin-dependent oxidoreductase (nitroreductase family)
VAQVGSGVFVAAYSTAGGLSVHAIAGTSTADGSCRLGCPVLARRVGYTGRDRNTNMGSRKYRIVTRLERANNRVIRFALRRGIAPGTFALLETTGRRTGAPRHTPVGNGLIGDTFWLVAAHGTDADYVRNLLDNPRVRVKIRGRWRPGAAVVLPDDDPVARSRTLPYRWDAAIGRLMASAPLTIRIDLDAA